jgi:hypothetical protein
MLCVAVNGVESLPERYREYKALIAPISVITSLRTEDLGPRQAGGAR